jgi:serine/threonine protein kinase/sugar lactone lactonase YvrE
MTVLPGSKIGPYDIIAQIGAGGMGEVYRARDSRLGRDVAIKVLPASFSADPDRLQRFAQEARAAAALSHPNILAIFDIGEDKGAPYVVSELLEGETLRDRLRSGALTSRKAIDYALQFAKGLAAAHDKGIVHRDLKPENLFITEDNRLKILDFGLAKLTRPQETESSGDAPTMQVATDAGMVMGTVGYMSPEQVRGKPADHRSDLFSFGAILYEMLSGKRAFHADTPADTMSAILKDDPPELSETNRVVPPGLERIVHHCLEKNQAQRFQSASDVAFNLEALTEISGTSRSGVQAVASPAPRRWLLPVLAAALIAASYAGVFFYARKNPGAAGPTFHRLTFRRGTILSARFSPDGQTIVYGSALEGKPVELITTRFDSNDSRSLGFEKTQLLAISSTGELAVALRAHSSNAFLDGGTLARVSLAGGAPREILDNVESADWTPDASDLAVTHGAGFSADLEFPVGHIIYQGRGWVSHVRISRKGDFLAFADHILNGDDGRVVIVDRNGQHAVSSSFYTTIEGVAWSSDGKEVWFTASPSGAARALYAMDMKGRERLVMRVPGTLTLQDITREGRVLLSEDNAQVGIMALPPGEQVEKNLSWFDWSLLSDLSPDGKTLAFSETGEASNGKYGVFLRATDGSPAIRLGDGTFPALSPDGKWVAALDNASPPQIQLLPTGTGQQRRLTNDSLEHVRLAWVPDGTGLIFTAVEGNRPIRSYWMDLNGKSHAITPEGTAGTIVSRDSKDLLATDSAGKRFLYPLQGGEAKPLTVSFEPNDIVMQFAPDGKSLLVAQRGPTLKVSRINLDSNHRELVRELAPADPAGIQTILGARFSADGKSYAYTYYRVLSDLWVVDGLK